MITGYKALELGIPSSVIMQQRKDAEQREQAEFILEQFKESECILDILRAISAVHRKTDEATLQKFMQVMQASVPAFQDMHQPGPIDPREFFAGRFPEQIKKYGSAFFGNDAFLDGRRIFIPDSVNEDAFAAILGGDHRLGHQVVWCSHEETFYFQDHRVDAFFPTTEDKLGILASNYLIKASERCPSVVAKAVLKLRMPATVRNVVQTAKTMLEADRSFFSGKEGKRRMVDGKLINPVDTPLHEIFIKDAIVPEPAGRITLTDCYHKYYRFCRDQGMPAPTRTEFRSILVDAIRSAFNIGLRHDVPGPNGKQANGWRGIAYRQNSRFITASLN